MSDYILSKAATNLIASEIRKISGKIDERKAKGENIYNLTIGDFDPKVFPIPELLKEEIKKAYDENQTNYPPSYGVLSLRQSVSAYLKQRGGFDYDTDEIVIGSGVRPLTYTIFKTIVDPGEKIIFPAPSWNNNCYVQLVDSLPAAIETSLENNFVPSAEDIKPHLSDAVLLALNSPLNPSGTAYSEKALKEIIDLAVEENKRRKGKRKPLYIFFDMVYWILVYGNTRHFNPVKINPEIREHIIFVDGISKCLAATGVRLGWAFGPKFIMNKIQSILAHIGAWAPKPEQIAVGRYLADAEEVDKYFGNFRNELFSRLNIFYDGFINLKNKGYNVDAIPPQGALYLTVKIDIRGLKTKDGMELITVDDVLSYVLEEAKMALVPFYAFGASKDSPWFRLSVGTCTVKDAKDASAALMKALGNLKK